MERTKKKKTTIEEEEDNSLLLPDEITIEILSRLPAESVMRCKRVCKIWRALIVDPDFINMQIRRSISYYTMNTNAAETEWVVFPSKVSHDFDYQLQFVEYNNDNCYDNEDEKINPIKLSKPIIYRPMTITDDRPLRSPSVKKIRSCNGLIFMITYAKNMFVCNPFTSEYIDLPQRFNTFRFYMGFSRGTMSMASGFGYHSSTNEYKVVIIYYYDNRSSYSKGQVTIYTLGSGRWRDNGEISHRVIGDTKSGAGGVLFNGALHWLTEKMEIVSFDLADEEDRIVPSPQLQSQSKSQLGLLGGCLYVTEKRSIHDSHDETSTDIWVMDSKEYSWSKKYSISWESGLSNHRPLALLKSGRIVLHRSGQSLISYDPETESSIVVDESKFYSVYTYIKTIVSLKALGETDAMIFDQDECDSLYSDLIENSKREVE